MAYVSATPRAAFDVNTGWFANLIESVRLRIERARAYRRTYDELSLMSERELADINLSGENIRDVALEAAAHVH